MTFTKLVIWFNKEKILVGLFVTIVLCLAAQGMCISYEWTCLLYGIAGLIIGNIMLALIASYLLFDRSPLFKADRLIEKFSIGATDRVCLIHASFDPLSKDLEQHLEHGLHVFNIYGNRHAEDSAVHLSNKIFPPNSSEVVVHADNLPLNDDSVDVILAITALHEIPTQDGREAFFQEAERILTKNGRIIVIEQTRNWINTLTYNIGVFHFIRKRDWYRAFNASNLHLSDEKPLTAFCRVFILTKSRGLAIFN